MKLCESPLLILSPCWQQDRGRGAAPSPPRAAKGESPWGAGREMSHRPAVPLGVSREDRAVALLLDWV